MSLETVQQWIQNNDKFYLDEPKIASGKSIKGQVDNNYIIIISQGQPADTGGMFLVLIQIFLRLKSKSDLDGRQKCVSRLKQKLTAFLYLTEIK